jgi:glyoxylase-like metal-dependent hydrolase (beta-lactamase superfamily II)
VASGSDQYQVTIVKYGTRSTSKSDVFLNYPLYHEADEPIEMDYFVWIVRNADRTVVVDTGFSRHGGEVRRRTQLVDVREAFREFGVDPELAPDVILTHAHYDHVGNLDFFPRSRVFMAAREREFWRSRHASRALFHHSVEDAELAHLDEVARAGRLVLFEDRVGVAPGIEVLVVGGHTPGQCVVKVDTSDGAVLLASDAVHYFEEYERDRLFTSVADLVEMYEGFDTIRAMIDSGEVAHLVPGHDPGTLRRFTPVAGAYASLAATIGAAA